MTKNLLNLLLLTILLVSTSCKKELKSMMELEVDYKVVELEYGFDNYMKNLFNKSEQIVIKQRNLVVIKVEKNGFTEIEGQIIHDSLIINELKKFIIPSPQNETMPITIEKEFKHSGKVDVNKNIIVLGIYDKELNYEKYREIRNKIYIAFNQVRNEFALAKFNQSTQEIIDSDKESDNEKWMEINKIFPIRYTETVKEK
ncbi:hypothetical protein [uncultured Maribacter sp.]|uniref:hypothetical protein n=1 Tax=uncultured Maribacter sp. TaxID=431308 RepID=UPI0026286C1A|nr:hypothetical protein [uncultured Maribacter sp.]